MVEILSQFFSSRIVWAGCLLTLVFLTVRFAPKWRYLDIRWARKVETFIFKKYVRIIFLMVLFIFFAGFYFYLWDIINTVKFIVQDLSALAKQKDGRDLSGTLNDLAQSSAILLGALIAATSLVFTLIRMWINERTTRATEEGLITDRINAAVASLGADKTIKTEYGEITVANIAVRVGAILAMERMAKQNDGVHCHIIEILSTYVRQETRGLTSYAKQFRDKPREDIQTTINVIGRRTEEQIAIEPLDLLDLSHSFLNHTNFTNGCFSRVDFRNASLSHAKVEDANFSNADFYGAEMRMINFKNTNFDGANLIGADLKKTKFSSSPPIRVPFFSLSDFQGTAFKRIDLSHSDITEENLKNCFGDASVSLSSSLARNPKWPTVVLDLWDFDTEWEKWLADPDGYVFDPTQYGNRYRDQMG